MAEEKKESNDAVLETKMKDIVTPAQNDILCGRSKETHHHPGNLSYRGLVNLNKSFYASCEKSHKGRIAQGIVAAIRAQKPPGRFLVLDPKTSLYSDIGDKKAIEKTSQALREGQPKTREKIHKQMKVEREESHDGSPSGMCNVQVSDLLSFNVKSTTENHIEPDKVPSKNSNLYLPNQMNPTSSTSCESKIDPTASSGVYPSVVNGQDTCHYQTENHSEQAQNNSVGSEESNNAIPPQNVQKKRMSSVTLDSITDLVSLEALRELNNALDADVPRSPSNISIEKDYDVFSGSVCTEIRCKDMKKSNTSMEKAQSLQRGQQPDLCMSMGTIQASLRSSAFAHDVNQDDLMSVTSDMRSLNMSTMGESVVSTDLPYGRKMDYEIDTPVYNEREHKFHEQNHENLLEAQNSHPKNVQNETDMDVASLTNSIPNSSHNKRSHPRQAPSWSDVKKPADSFKNNSVLSDFSEMSNMTAFRRQIDGSFVTQGSQNHQHMNYVPNFNSEVSLGNNHQDINPNIILHNPDNRKSALARSMSEKEARARWGNPRKSDNTSSLLSEFTTISGTHEYDVSKDPYV